jgi:hypothetical protein
MYKKLVSLAIFTLLIISLASLELNIPAISSSREISLLDSNPWGDWQHYHNYTEIVSTLLFLNTSYPSVVDVFSIGKSWENKDIYCIRLTNESNSDLKPEVFFVGYHHAREPISAELPLYFAIEAATSFGVDATKTNMLNHSEIFIVPTLNVDGFDAMLANEWHRKNVHPFDEDGDGSLDEDPPDDEDGDGYIEDLYSWNGSNYTFVRWEGIDNDGDGLFNEDWVGGVDLNRNYGFQWNATSDTGSPYPEAEDYRGPAPFSEPETQAIRDLALSHNFKYAISFHSGANIILYPWGYTENPTSDDSLFREIAGNLSSLVGSPYAQSGVGLYTSSGLWDDWMYANRSTLALTCEIYTNADAWQYESGPSENTWWEKGVFQFFNPDPADIEIAIQRWLPVFTYITNRAITNHNIATTNVKPLKTVVGQGFPAQINVTVANKGSFTETFNITLCANKTAIETREVTLASGSFTTVTFTWNTSNFAKGNYTISANATTLPDETATSDNTFTDSWLLITIAGDTNGDTYVNGTDAVLLGSAFGSNRHDPAYNANADIDGNGHCNAKDAVILGIHFSEHWE